VRPEDFRFWRSSPKSASPESSTSFEQCLGSGGRLGNGDPLIHRPGRGGTGVVMQAAGCLGGGFRDQGEAGKHMIRQGAKRGIGTERQGGLKCELPNRMSKTKRFDSSR